MYDSITDRGAATVAIVHVMVTASSLNPPPVYGLPDGRVADLLGYRWAETAEAHPTTLEHLGRRQVRILRERHLRAPVRPPPPVRPRHPRPREQREQRDRSSR